MKRKTIKVDYLARVEGEGGLTITTKNGTVSEVRLEIFEPPRFFEAFLRGRNYSEAPDITARICGICPVAYQMSSVNAMEAAFGVRVEGQLRALRRLLYCGEWIESHALHIYLLHAPDFLGFPDAIRMAQSHHDLVEQGLRLKKIGNELMTVIGGREIHPINVRVGGFYRVPTPGELTVLSEKLRWALKASIDTARVAATLPFPEFERDYTFVALRHPDEYPMNEGRIVSNTGLDIDVADYEQHFAEEHVPYANALHSIFKDHGAYLVGPLARYALNRDRLTPLAKMAALSAGLADVCRNPFKGIVVRAVEMVLACEEALRLIDQYVMPENPAIPLVPKSATGCGCTEAPRGILYHRYRLDDAGTILEAKIVPPTSQNQKSIEHDLRGFVERNISLPIDELTLKCEQTIRNYDPCISCATHFLKLKIEEAGKGTA